SRDIKEKSFSSAKRKGSGAPADIANHRLIDRESRIGIDDLVALVYESENREENDRLATGNDDHLIGTNLHSARAAYLVSAGLCEFGISGRRAVVCPSAIKRIHGGMDYVGGCIEIRLTDFKMNDVF